MADLTGSEW